MLIPHLKKRRSSSKKSTENTRPPKDFTAVSMDESFFFFTAANYEHNDWGSPILFFEYDPMSDTISQAPTPSNNEIFV